MVHIQAVVLLMVVELLEVVLHQVVGMFHRGEAPRQEMEEELFHR